MGESEMRKGAYKELSPKTNENVVREEQEPVRKALIKYLNRYPNNIVAADKIGVHITDLYNWKSGSRRIPEWMCEVLGFKRVYIYCGASVGVTTTDLAQKCLANEAQRHQERMTQGQSL
jgi:hypothetical protein